MTYRKQPILKNQIYHIFNRGIAKVPIFFDKRDYLRFIDVINFYRFSSQEMRFSYYNRLEYDSKKKFLDNLYLKGEQQVSIYSYCLMPNHFHFVLKEITDDGIKNFAGNLQNSYAKYINTKMKRTGSLFQEMFKAVRIDSDEQLLHTVRYVHLNPLISFLVKDFDQLIKYPWSSLNDYIGKTNLTPFLDTSFINSYYKSSNELLSFTKDQADFQNRLKEIMHLTLDFV